MVGIVEAIQRIKFWKHSNNTI